MAKDPLLVFRSKELMGKRIGRLAKLLREVETYFAGPYDEHYQVDLWARISDELRPIEETTQHDSVPANKYENEKAQDAVQPKEKK